MAHILCFEMKHGVIRSFNDSFDTTDGPKSSHWLKPRVAEIHTAYIQMGFPFLRSWLCAYSVALLRNGPLIRINQIYFEGYMIILLIVVHNGK